MTPFFAALSISEKPVLSVPLSTFPESIDKAAKKGVIKNNTADRYKARLAAAAKRTAAK